MLPNLFLWPGMETGEFLGANERAKPVRNVE